MTKKFSVWWVSAVLSLMVLAGCSQVTVQTVSDPLPYYQKRVALFVAEPTSELGLELMQNISGQVEERMKTSPKFQSFQSFAEVRSQVDNSIELTSGLSQLISSFAISGVTDRDISTRLANSLKIDQFLFVQASQFVCAECEGGYIFLVKINLIEAKSGKVLWRGRMEDQLNLEEMNKAKLNEVATRSTTLILDEFAATFNLPWHRLREKNLATALSSSPQG